MKTLLSLMGIISLSTVLTPSFFNNYKTYQTVNLINKDIEIGSPIAGTFGANDYDMHFVCYITFDMTNLFNISKSEEIKEKITSITFPNFFGKINLFNTSISSKDFKISTDIIPDNIDSRWTSSIETILYKSSDTDTAEAEGSIATSLSLYRYFVNNDLLLNVFVYFSARSWGTVYQSEVSLNTGSIIRFIEKNN